MNFCFVLLDKTTTDAGYGRPNNVILTNIANALEAYLNNDLAPHYGGEYVVRVGSGPTDVLPNEVACNIVDDLSQVAPGAAAFHDDESGMPVIWAALNEFTDFVAGDSALSEGLAHEMAELSVDPGANQYADRPDGRSEAKETSDRLQGTGYMKLGCMVANFLLPSAWVPGAPGPWDFGKVLQNQYDITPLGYVILRRQGLDAEVKPIPMQDWGKVVAQRLTGGRTDMVVLKGSDHAMRALVLARKRHIVSRTYRRGVRF